MEKIRDASRKEAETEKDLMARRIRCLKQRCAVFTIAPPLRCRYSLGMPDSSHPVENPAQAFERFRDALKQIMTVPKDEILRREAEAKEQRKGRRHDNKAT